MPEPAMDTMAPLIAFLVWPVTLTCMPVTVMPDSVNWTELPPTVRVMPEVLMTKVLPPTLRVMDCPAVWAIVPSVNGEGFVALGDGGGLVARADRDRLVAVAHREGMIAFDGVGFFCR